MAIQKIFWKYFYRKQIFAFVINAVTTMKLEFYAVSVAHLKWDALQSDNICVFFSPFSTAHCYKKVLDETKDMQQKINAELGLNPIEQDVIVLYDGEKNEQPAEFWKGKRIVEMKKQRPMWFSKNLIQRTTQPLATTKEVKPTDLG